MILTPKLPPMTGERYYDPEWVSNPQVFLCGTRKVVELWTSPDLLRDLRVVCATCGGGGSLRHYTLASATHVCVRDSARPCPARPPCGAR